LTLTELRQNFYKEGESRRDDKFDTFDNIAIKAVEKLTDVYKIKIKIFPVTITNSGSRRLTNVEYYYGNIDDSLVPVASFGDHFELIITEDLEKYFNSSCKNKEEKECLREKDISEYIPKMYNNKTKEFEIIGNDRILDAYQNQVENLIVSKKIVQEHRDNELNLLKKTVTASELKIIGADVIVNYDNKIKIIDSEIRNINTILSLSEDKITKLKKEIRVNDKRIIFLDDLIKSDLKKKFSKEEQEMVRLGREVNEKLIILKSLNQQGGGKLNNYYLYKYLKYKFKYSSLVKSSRQLELL